MMNSETVRGLPLVVLALFLVFGLSLLHGFSLLKVDFVPLVNFSHVDGCADFFGREPLDFWSVFLAVAARCDVVFERTLLLLAVELSLPMKGTYFDSENLDSSATAPATRASTRPTATSKDRRCFTARPP